MVNEGAGNGHALTLSAGEFIWTVRHAVSQIDRGECLFGHLMSLGRSDATVDQRQFDIVQGGGPSQQVEGLKDKTHFLIANARQLVVVHLGDVFAVEPVFTL